MEDKEFPIFTVEDEMFTSDETYSIFHDSGLATSAATDHASYLSVLGNDSQGRPRVPPLPNNRATLPMQLLYKESVHEQSC
jgi:hypothetical protein